MEGRANICQICLKGNCNNEFVSMSGDRDLRLKFFCCFSISFPDDKEGLLLCKPCIDQLNSFYQLKNHVQRAHSVYHQSHSTFYPFADIPSLLEDLAVTNSIERDIAEALQRLSQAPSPAIVNQDRSFKVHSANTSTPIVPNAIESIDLDNYTENNNEAASSTSESVEIKQEPEEQVQNSSATTADDDSTFTPPPPTVKPKRQRGQGKQRSEIGKLIVKDEASNTYPCTKCPKVFNNYQSTYMHMRNVHFKIGHCFCDLCGKSFYGKAALQTHIMSKHNKQFQCKTCFKVFKNVGDLISHRMRSHRAPK